MPLRRSNRRSEEIGMTLQQAEKIWWFDCKQDVYLECLFNDDIMTGCHMAIVMVRSGREAISCRAISCEADSCAGQQPFGLKVEYADGKRAGETASYFISEDSHCEIILIFWLPGDGGCHNVLRVES